MVLFLRSSRHILKIRLPLSNSVNYRGQTLMRNSVAYELWEAAQKDGTLTAKLAAHLKAVNASYLKMQGGPLPPHLENYRAGDHPEDWK